MEVEFIVWTLMGALFVFVLALLGRVALYVLDWYNEYRYINRPAGIARVSTIDYHGDLY